MRFLLVFISVIFLVVSAAVSFAQNAPMFANPLVSVDQILRDRGDVSSATLEVVYRYSGNDGSAYEIKFVVGSDWVGVYRGTQLAVLDYKLGRLFSFEGEENEFVSYNIRANLMFRIQERQNREFLAHILTEIGADIVPGACDMDAELGISIPGVGEPTNPEVVTAAQEYNVECNGQTVGRLIFGAESVPPPAFWPTLVNELPMHPQMYGVVLEHQQIPELMETSFITVAGEAGGGSWHLESTREIVVAYPLNAASQNIAAERLDEWVEPGFGAFGIDVVSGVAAGGPPSIDDWDTELERLRNSEGVAAVAMKLPLTLRLFPNYAERCPKNPELAFCTAVSNLPATLSEDTAVQALYAIAAMEQSGNLQGVAPLMLAARSSSLFEDPVLGAAYALALAKGGDSLIKQCAATGLETDIVALQSKAIRAYPYDPFYWQDLGDTFLKNYHFPEAYLLYDVAHAIPAADPARNDAVLGAHTAFAERVSSAFPDFFLP